MAKFAANSKKLKPRGKPFAKGQSGNPVGRPKKTPELRAIEELAKEHSQAALLALVDEANTGRGAPRVAAAVALLDRGWGQPTKRIESESNDTVTHVDQRVRSATEIIMEALGRGTSGGGDMAGQAEPVLPASLCIVPVRH